MATYGGAASGLEDLVRQRKRAEYGATEDPYAPPEDGGFTGGQMPGPIETGGTDPLPVTQTAQASTPYPSSSSINTSVSVGQQGPTVEQQLAAAGIQGPWSQGTNTPGATPTNQGTPATIADAYRTTLLAKLNSPIQASITDPALAAQSDAYSVGQQRARDQNRDAIAERLAANGISDSGAMDQAVQGLYQTQGENQGGFNAKLVGDELTRQRDELQSYMTMAGARLTAQESMALQARIAELNAQISAQGQTNQVNQYNSTMGWNQNIWDYLQNMYPQQQVMGG